MICRYFGNIRYILYLCKNFDDSGFHLEVCLGPWNLKWITWRDHAHIRESLSCVNRGLLWSICIPNLKCLRLPATKKWKATPNVKILVLKHPLGDLGVTHRLDAKRIVDFLLTIIELFFASSYGYGTIKRNLSKSAFSEGVGHFECKFEVDGTSPAICL